MARGGPESTQSGIAVSRGSAVRLPDVDFHGLRPYGSPASRANAFEELVSILLRVSLVEWPAGTRFNRFGNPDGGREGNAILPNGDVWAWQAKYLFAFDNDEIGQIDKSVKRALEREPNLRRYFVALPYDLPAGDTDGKRPRTSAHTKWTSKVAEWTALATGRGMNVEFVYVGAHELTTALTEPEHAGRLRYWFDRRYTSRSKQSVSSRASHGPMRTVARSSLRSPRSGRLALNLGLRHVTTSRPSNKPLNGRARPSFVLNSPSNGFLRSCDPTSRSRITSPTWNVCSLRLITAFGPLTVSFGPAT
jgi:hypothetical protein